MECMNNWKTYFINKSNHATILFTAGLGLVVIPSLFPFLLWIQNRKGKQINDPILELLPSIDLSWPIFILMIIAIGYSVFQASCNPPLIIKTIAAYFYMQIFRSIMLLIVPLDPPKGLIYLMDPLVHNTFYSGNYITRDLFFSGHAATVYLLWIMSKNRVILLAAVGVSIMLLIQHIHYTIDVLAAPIFAWLSFKCLPKKIFGE